MKHIEIHTSNTPVHARSVVLLIGLGDDGELAYSQTPTGYVFATIFPVGKDAAWAVMREVCCRSGAMLAPAKSDIVRRALASLPVAASLPAGRRVHLMAVNGQCVAQA